MCGCEGLFVDCVLGVDVVVVVDCVSGVDVVVVVVVFVEG